MLSKLSSPWVFLMALALVFTTVACDNEDDPMPSTDKTIVEVAADDAQFSTLVSALQRTGLDAVLANKNASYTVFAPTNDAFTNLGVDLATLTDDELSAILLYHVLGAEVLSTQIQEGKMIMDRRMIFRTIFGLLIVLIVCSCFQQTSIDGLPIESRLRIENGINRGVSYTDSLGTRYNLRYIPITITNDSTFPIHIQIAFSNEYDYPTAYGDEKFKVFSFPKKTVTR